MSINEPNMPSANESTALIRHDGPFVVSRFESELGDATDLTADQATFFGEIAHNASAQLQGSAALLWEINNNEITLVGDIELADIEIDKSSPVLDHHLDYVENTAEHGKCAVISPAEFFGEQGATPDDSQLSKILQQHTQLFIPYIARGNCVAILVVLVENDVRLSAYDLVIISQRIELMLFKRQSNRRETHRMQLESRLGDMNRLQELQVNVGRNLDEKKNAFDIVNELASYFGKGRVTYCARRGTSCRVKAVSGQAVFNRRSPTLHHIERLSNVAAKMSDHLFMPEDEDELPNRLLKQFDKYFEAADTKSIALIPVLKHPEPSTDPNDLAAVVRDRESKPGKVIGVIVVEGLGESIDRDTLLEQWEPVQPIIENSASAAHQYSGFFMMPVLRRLGQVADLFRGHHRNKALAVTALLLLTMAALILIPGDFKIRCKGIIQPVERSQIFAEEFGVIDELLVADGDTVTKDQILVKLKNPGLEADFVEVEGQLRVAQSQLQTVIKRRMLGNSNRIRTADRNTASPQGDEQSNLLQETARLESRIKSLEKRLELLDEKRGQLLVKSPRQGIVISFNLPKRLTDKPVKPGDLLMVVAETAGPWELELRVPDNRSGYVLKEWENKSTDEKQQVTYCLASNPSQFMEGSVRQIAPAANLNEQDGNVLRALVDLQDHPHSSQSIARPGTEVVAQIHAGRRSIGYCKLYEFFDWTRRVWFQFS